MLPNRRPRSSNRSHRMHNSAAAFVRIFYRRSASAGTDEDWMAHADLIIDILHPAPPGRAAAQLLTSLCGCESRRNAFPKIPCLAFGWMDVFRSVNEAGVLTTLVAP
ncbi:hypothetical protein ACLOJK_012945, partial [Asimina triloba]